MKKLFALALSALMTLTCFAGCGGSHAESDTAYIKEKGRLVIGITEYEPMDYKDENDEWTGFDAEFARLFCEKLGVEAEFLVLSDWDQKYFELETKNIDAIWNGMTLTEEARSNASCSDPYLVNSQVVVMKKDVIGQYPDAESVKDLKFACENGSAGQAALAELGITEAVALQDQAAALMEVAAGTAEACVIDITMAKAMTGEGTNYADLAIGTALSTEEYAVAFRKGSDLTEQLNNCIKELTEDGSLAALAEQYSLTLAQETPAADPA